MIREVLINRCGPLVLLTDSNGGAPAIDAYIITSSLQHVGRRIVGAVTDHAE